MPILKNHRHEKFAQELAKGKSAAEAQVAAGYKANTGNATTLKKHKSVQMRLAEILNRNLTIEAKAIDKAAERLSITKERVLAELAKIGFANMADYMKASSEGDPYLDFRDLTRDQAAALSEVTVEDFTEGRGEDKRAVRRVKFKLHDKKGALVDIGRELGMFVTRTEVGGPGDFERLSDAELEERLAREAAELFGVDGGEAPAAAPRGIRGSGRLN